MNNSKTFTVTANHEGVPLIQFLAEQLDISRKAAKRLLDQRVVFVNGKRVWMARHNLQKRDLLEVHLPDRAANLDPEVLFEDKHYMIINKSPGSLSTGKKSVEQTVQKMKKDPAIKAVHRLDADTSGCLLFAKNPEAWKAAVELFKEHEIQKLYRALVVGRAERSSFIINQSIDDLPARTKCRVLSSSEQATLLSISIETGRTHQIRVHLSGIKHPVVGDKKYKVGGRVPEHLRAASRQMLHAHGLKFRHPLKPGIVDAQAPLPPDFKKMMRLLKLH